MKDELERVERAERGELCTPQFFLKPFGCGVAEVQRGGGLEEYQMEEEGRERTMEQGGKRMKGCLKVVFLVFKKQCGSAGCFVGLSACWGSCSTDVDPCEASCFPLCSPFKAVTARADEEL